MTLPPEARPLLAALLPAFTQPTATRFVTQLVAAVLTRHRHRDRLTLVGKLHTDANRFDPSVKGVRRRKPREAVARTRRLKSLRVAWYGGGTRQVGVTSEAADWYKAGHGLVPGRCVRPRSDGHPPG